MQIFYKFGLIVDIPPNRHNANSRRLLIFPFPFPSWYKFCYLSSKYRMQFEMKLEASVAITYFTLYLNINS